MAGVKTPLLWNHLSHFVAQGDHGSQNSSKKNYYLFCSLSQSCHIALLKLGKSPLQGCMVTPVSWQSFATVNCSSHVTHRWILHQHFPFPVFFFFKGSGKWSLFSPFFIFDLCDSYAYHISFVWCHKIGVVMGLSLYSFFNP